MNCKLSSGKIPMGIRVRLLSDKITGKIMEVGIYTIYKCPVSKT